MNQKQDKKQYKTLFISNFITLIGDKTIKQFCDYLEAEKHWRSLDINLLIIDDRVNPSLIYLYVNTPKKPTSSLLKLTPDPVEIACATNNDIDTIFS